MDERNEPVRERPVERERETTIITTGGDRGGGSGAVLAVVVLLVLAVIAFLLFSGVLNGAGDGQDINVDIKTPDVELPKVDLPAPGNGS